MDEGEAKGGRVGESGMPSLSQSFPTDHWNLSGGEMKILLCLMNPVSGWSPELPTLHGRASRMLAAVNMGSFSLLLFFKQIFQGFFILFLVDFSCGFSR